MLVRAARPNFDGVFEAAKLLIWSFSRKRDFHSRYNDYNPNYRSDRGNYRSDRGNYRSDRGNYRLERGNFRTPNRKWEMSEDFDSLPSREYKLEDLKKFERNFYTPHPNVINRSEVEVKEFQKKHDIHIFGNKDISCPSPILSFDELNVENEAMDTIRELNYFQPTPIQSQTWPIALSGLNMVGIGQTGSGKTLGFVLPGMIHIRNQPPLEASDGPIALVIAPTRELAQQTNKVVSPFANNFSFKNACVFGGKSREVQLSYLHKAHICVGTPGRLIDFLRSGDLTLERCTYIVLDEADRLLDMGFEPQIRAIMNNKRPDSQILMWSATWPNDVQNLAWDFLGDYIGVKFGSAELYANPNITQNVQVCREIEKKELLFNLLEEISQKDENKTLIFAKTKVMVQHLYNYLKRKGYSVEHLHGDKSQLYRDEALASFRSGQVNILVGTEIVGRGLDITDIRYVINYDFPSTIEDYIHLIGRTARGKTEGTSYSFFTTADSHLASNLIKILNEANQEVNPQLMDLAEDRKLFRMPFGGQRRSRPRNEPREFQF